MSTNERLYRVMTLDVINIRNEFEINNIRRTNNTLRLSFFDDSDSTVTQKLIDMDVLPAGVEYALSTQGSNEHNIYIINVKTGEPLLNLQLQCG